MISTFTSIFFIENSFVLPPPPPEGDAVTFGSGWAVVVTSALKALVQWGNLKPSPNGRIERNYCDMVMATSMVRGELKGGGGIP